MPCALTVLRFLTHIDWLSLSLAKLLGKESDDVDISTSPDPVTGLKFATLFEQYLETLGQRDIVKLGSLSHRSLPDS